MSKTWNITKSLCLTLTLAYAALTLPGCSQQEADHDHSSEHDHNHDHDHDHDHEGEPKTEEAAPTASTTDAKPYPLDVCIVSGEKLGSMGEAISMVHEGQEIKFCCDHCVPDFKKDPAKYLTKLNK